jgi:hypothetical protein
MLKHCGAIVLIFTAAVGVAAGQSGTAANSALQVTLRTDKTQYHAGDTLIVECQLKNMGDTPIFVSSELAIGSSPGCRPGGLWIEAFDNKGKRSHGEYASFGDCAAPTSGPLLVRLDKGQFFGVEGNEALARLLNSPGAYKLVLHYVGPVTEQANKEPQSFSLGANHSGAAREAASAPVAIRVLARSR